MCVLCIIQINLNFLPFRTLSIESYIQIYLRAHARTHAHRSTNKLHTIRTAWQANVRLDDTFEVSSAVALGMHCISYMCFATAAALAIRIVFTKKKTHSLHSTWHFLSANRESTENTTKTMLYHENRLKTQMQPRKKPLTRITFSFLGTFYPNLQRSHLL